MQRQLTQLLEDCTVRILSGETLYGTGFWVSPGRVLTCAHVVRQALKPARPVAVEYRGARCEITDEMCFLDDAQDVAVLPVPFADHPCAWLDEAYEIHDPCYAFGYTKDKPFGESIAPEVEGILRDEADQDVPRIKLKLAQVKHGLSGAPLFNSRTGYVCGMVKSTFDPGSSLVGGTAVSVSVLYSIQPDLLERSRAFHARDRRWTQARMVYQDVIAYESSSQPGGVSAASLLFSAPASLSAEGLFMGRSDALTQIEAALPRSRRVLVTGMGGIGKTTLMMAVARRWLEQERGPVLWLENPGVARVEALLETLAQWIDPEGSFAGRPAESKPGAFRGLLDASPVRLLMIDNVVEPETVYQLLRAVPDGLPVLVSSRQQFNLRTIIDLDSSEHELSYEEAVAILEFHAQGTGFQQDPCARELCRLLGRHPLAMAICGSAMRVPRRISPEKQFLKLEKNLLKLAEPGHFARKGHESLIVLLESCVEALDPSSRQIFTAIGGFFSPGISLELLASLPGLNDDSVETALAEMEECNLASSLPGTDFYRLHDLVFAYARSLNEMQGSDHQAAVQSVIAFLQSHRTSYDLLALEMPNLLGAANAVQADGKVQIMSLLVLGDFPLPGPESYFAARGYSLGLLEQLDQAIDACRGLGEAYRTTLHFLLSKRGNAAAERGEYSLGVRIFHEALPLSPSIERKTQLLCFLAYILGMNDQADEAAACFAQASRLVQETGDQWLQGYLLEKQILVCAHRKDLETAQRLSKELVEMNNRCVEADPSKENLEALFYALLNLGSTELELAIQRSSTVEPAFATHSRALQIAEQLHAPLLVNYAQVGRAEEFHYLGQREEAGRRFLEALAFWRKREMLADEKNLEETMRRLGYVVPPADGK